MKYAKALFEATGFKHVKEIIPDSTKVASITIIVIYWAWDFMMTTAWNILEVLNFLESKKNLFLGVGWGYEMEIVSVDSPIYFVSW